MARFLMAVVSLAGLPVGVFAAGAALGPEYTDPYRLRVVVHFADHRLLTPVFKGQVRREIHDGLQAALGDMGTVDVLDSPARLTAAERSALKEAEARGLEHAFEDRVWRAISDTKTHLVLIDFADGRYEIQTRQHDGPTGLASPAVRRERTWDRWFVGRLSAQLIARDFGLVGTVLKVEGQKNETVELGIKGSKLGVPLGRWVSKGDVFAIAQVNRGKEPWSFQVQAAVLQVAEDPGDGVCRCRLFRRYQDAPSRLQAVGSALGFRCLKLGTVEAPVRLRFVDKESLLPINQSVRVLVRPYDFDNKSTREEEHATDRDGFMKTNRPFDKVAFVRVLQGEEPIAQFPVEILDNRTLVCPITVSAEAESRGQFDLERKRWENQLYERLLVLSDFRKELNKLLEKKQNKAAMEMAEEGRKNLDGDIAHLNGEREKLTVTARKIGTEKWLADGAQRLQELTAGRDELDRAIKNLKEVLNEEPAYQAIVSLLEQAKTHQSDLDFEGALALYDQALKAAAEHPNFAAKLEGWKKRIEELKKAWEVKGPEHAQARAFIYDTWPKLDTAAGLDENMERAEKAFQVCQKAGDRLTPLMLLKAHVAHAGRLTQELQSLSEQLNEENKDKAEKIVKTADRLEKLRKEVTAFVQPARGAAAAKKGG